MPATCRTVAVMKRTLAAVATVLLVACSGGNDDSSTEQESVAFNDADVEFVQGMIPHHEQAITMADMVDPSTVSADLAALASEIRGAQAPEIDTMRSLLAEWNIEEDPHAMHKMDHSSMKGMMSDDDLAALDESTGTSFERMWLEMMIEHHEGAVTMSETVIADGKHPRVRELAESIIVAQRDEISRMRALLGAQ